MVLTEGNYVLDNSGSSKRIELAEGMIATLSKQ